MIRYSIRTVTAPSLISLPITVAEAKAHLRVDYADDDALIEAQLRAAIDHVERHTAQVLSPRQMEMGLNGFPTELITIPRTPVTGIVSIKYSDPATGAEVTMATTDWRWSDVDADLLRPAFRAAWPTAAAERGSVRVRFNAGYDLGLAPAALVAAVKLLLGHFYGNREAVVTGVTATELPLAVEGLCADFRQMVL